MKIPLKYHLAHDRGKKKLGAFASSVKSRVFAHPILFIFILSVIVTLLIEILSRRSLTTGVFYLFRHPAIFTYNAVIIMLSLTPSLIFKRRAAIIMLVSAIWLGLGITNCVMMNLRSTPLAAVDFLLFRSVASIVNVYLNTIQLILICAGFLAIIAGFVYLYRTYVGMRIKFQTIALLFLTLCTTIYFGSQLIVKADTVSSSDESLTEVYENYGFVYCFSRSVIDSGVNRPEAYSEDAVERVVESVDGGSPACAPENSPNVIFVQLESFFDPYMLSEISYSQDPIPNFRELKENRASGALTVPTIGGGTANTEFEILTGMDLSYFGLGEYPYKTVLKRTTCESVAYSLKPLGYTGHAIHNHYGAFYGRNEVYSRLGFDSFTSLEYMQDVTVNPLGWADDSVLTEEIMKSLGSTDGKDLVFTVSVQPHGKYPSEVIDETQTIAVSGIEDEILRTKYEYYLNQLSETDEFIGELTYALSCFDEPVMLVLYGDHLPNLALTEEQLKNGDPYSTEYVVWTNYGDGYTSDRDLFAYELYSHVLDLAGIRGCGVFQKLHSAGLPEDEFEKAMELLEYDMLYGESYASDGELYAETELKMGTEEISVADVQRVSERLFVYGENFTPWSIVCVDGKKCETEFCTGNVLIADYDGEPGEAVIVSVAQIGESGDPLSVTEDYSCTL